MGKQKTVYTRREKLQIQDSRLKYIYLWELHDFNMDWYTGIGIEQLSNFIHVSF